MELGGIRILIVDDQPRVLDDVARMLEGQGCDVHTTDEPTTVVEEAKRIRPDVILLDVVMPKMDGYDVFEALQEDPSTRTISVVLMTAKAITFHMPASLLHELSGVITKPFSKFQLIRGIHAAMEKKDEDPGAEKA